MNTPSLRLRILTGVMRYVVKPKLRRTGTPDSAHRDFERAAPWLFSTPRGLILQDTGPSLKISTPTTDPDRAILYLHGGAFVSGSRRSYLAIAGRLAKRSNAAVYLADYPLIQDAPFPAAPDAVLAAWDNLMDAGLKPNQVCLAGDSAGGNLVFGLLARLLARGECPACVVAFSPWVDLTLSGTTIEGHKNRDPLIPVSRMQEAVDLYLDGADARDPIASPLFADFPNPPPILIQSGEDEVLLSDSEQIAQRTGATLEIWPDVPHVWQIFDGRLPEANAAMRKVAAFLHTSFDRASR